MIEISHRRVMPLSQLHTLQVKALVPWNMEVTNNPCQTGGSWYYRTKGRNITTQ